MADGVKVAGHTRKTDDGAHDDQCWIVGVKRSSLALDQPKHADNTDDIPEKNLLSQRDVSNGLYKCRHDGKKQTG